MPPARKEYHGGGGPDTRGTAGDQHALVLHDGKFHSKLTLHDRTGSSQSMYVVPHHCGRSSEPGNLMMYEALLIVTFGGPDSMADVLPFLENVLRGKRVPRERMLEVAHHYELFKGRSPINAQNQKLKADLETRMRSQPPRVPVYIGNRNWHPMLPETLQGMKEDGIRRALAFVASGYSSYSGCRQYREDIERARNVVGEGVPVVDKTRVFFNHPLFIQANAENLQAALLRIPEPHRPDVTVLFTAHSIPVAMASRCAYVDQLAEAARLTAEVSGVKHWRLVYQSRSGPPHQPWLEPDVCDAIRECAAKGARHLACLPIGFTSDHMEVLYDLDTEAQACAGNLGIQFERASTAGHHPVFVQMVHDLLTERMMHHANRAAVGRFPASHDACPPDCCLSR